MAKISDFDAIYDKDGNRTYGSKATYEAIMEAAPICHGNIRAMADYCGITHTTVHTYKNTYPEIIEAIKEARKSILGTIENKLIEQAVNGNISAIIFYLKSQGGWSEKQRVELSGEVNATVQNAKSEAEFRQAMEQWKEQAPDDHEPEAKEDGSQAATS